MTVTEKFFLTLENVYFIFRQLFLGRVKPKYLSANPPDEKVSSFETLLKEVQAKLAPETDNIWALNCTYKNKTRTTYITLQTEFDSNKPSMVFHHGAGESNYGIKLIWLKRAFKEANIFTINAQHHTSRDDYLQNCMQSFTDWSLTFVGSVLAIEEITKFHKKRSTKPFLVSGGSMGGIVSSLHFFYFGTADSYLPIVAYPNMGEIFLDRAYETVIDQVDLRRKNDSYFEAFKIPDKLRRTADKNKITIILGKYDPIIPYKYAKKFWEGYNVISVNTGHMSVATKVGLIKKEASKLLSFQQ